MTVTVTPHLNFRGDARDALAFYREVFDAELVIASYADMGFPDPETAERVAFGMLTAASGFRIMAYDAYPHLAWDRGVDPFFVSLRGTDDAELTRLWAGLSDGAEVRQALGPAPWAPLYGQLTDRFGITWVLDMEVGYPS